MNLLIINYEYPPLGGGGGIATQSLAEELAIRGHNIIVLTTHFHGLKFREELNGVQIYRVPVLGRIGYDTATMLSMFTWPITSIIIGMYLCFKNKFDLINTHFYSPTGPTGLILSKLFRIPNVMYAHGADIFDPERMDKTPSGKGWLAKLLRKSVLLQTKYLNAIIVQSSDTKKRLLEIIPKFESKINVIALPFQKPKFQVAINKDKSNSFKLVSIGRLVERKGYKYLIEAMKDLPEEISLTIIGDGPEKDNLKALITSLKLESRVELVGRVSMQEKYRILSESNCYVLSSLHEGMGMVLLEAMYCGLPIVATNFGGQVDLIDHNENGLLVNPKDSKGLSNAIDKMYNSNSLCSKFSKENVSRVKKYYSENIVDEYEQLFKSVC